MKKKAKSKDKNIRLHTLKSFPKPGMFRSVLDQPEWEDETRQEEE